MAEKKNQHAGVCRHCGGQVAAGAGRLERRANADGSYGWSAAHLDGDCKDEQIAVVPSGLPTWAVYCDGNTPAGLPTSGIHLVTSATRPDGEQVYPACDVARAIVTRESEGKT